MNERISQDHFTGNNDHHPVLVAVPVCPLKLFAGSGSYCQRLNYLFNTRFYRPQHALYPLCSVCVCPSDKSFVSFGHIRRDIVRQWGSGCCGQWMHIDIRKIIELVMEI